MTLKEIKNWSVEIEKTITNTWKKKELFPFDSHSKKVYTIDTPPPYVNAPIHIGQAVTYCYMDFFARFKRMKGFSVIFPLGLDRNGLPIEVAAEKKFKVSALRTDRKTFLNHCKKLLEETSTETQDTFAKLGISFTSYNEGDHIGAVYKTDSDSYRALTQQTFIDLYKKGLVYEDVRVSNWDLKLQTTVADSEIEYEDLPSSFNFIEWKVKETGEKVLIGTTRPELICTCAMVIFNPKDKKYKHLKGKTIISPLFEKEVPIQPHPFAQMDKGTGLAMMCSAGDITDIQFFREQGLKPVIAINQDGKMNEHAAFLQGLKVKDARAKIIEMLKQKKLLKRQEHITHRTPVSERSGAEIEFIEMPEFYIKQLDFKEDIRGLSKKITFYPEESKKILDSWIDSISIDWPVSRRRFYATEVPLWYASRGEETLVAIPQPGKYYTPWNQTVPKDAEVYFQGKKIGLVKDFKDLSWEGETRVFDTWMDSSISELFILQYPKNKALFEKAFPVGLRPQGKEIVRTWLYYTLLRGFLETGKPAFKDVWINQHIVDEKGKKMSKSKGNVINPQDLVKEYGGEAIRLWAAIEGDLSKQDLSCSRERIKAEKKSLNKFLNVSKFVLLFEKPKKEPVLTSLDQLFVDYVESLTKDIERMYEVYDFYHPALLLRNFLWETFASHYIELVKARAYNQEKQFGEEEGASAKYTLYFLLERFTLLLYPILPQITSVVGENIHLDVLKSEWPSYSLGSSKLALVERLMAFNSEVWKQKNEQKISLKDTISGVEIPKALLPFKKDLTIAHSLV